MFHGNSRVKSLLGWRTYVPSTICFVLSFPAHISLLMCGSRMIPLVIYNFDIKDKGVTFKKKDFI